MDTQNEEQVIADLGFLSETAMEFLRLGPEKDLYRYIADRLRSLTGESWVFISSYHSERDATCLRTFSGMGRWPSRIFALVGEVPCRRYRKISEEAREALLTGRLHEVPGGVYELLYREMPRSVAERIAKIGRITGVYSMGLVCHSELFGAVAVVTRHGATLERPDMVEAFINQAAVAIRRVQAEERLNATEVRFRALMDQVDDIVAIVDRDLILEDINRRACEKLCYRREKLLGRSLVDLLEYEDRRRQPIPWDRIRRGRRVYDTRRVRTGDGRTRIYRGCLNPLADGRLLIIANDVTDIGPDEECP